MNIKKIILRTMLLFTVFALSAYIIKGNGSNDQLQTLLGVSSFIFGIFLAFYTANSHGRFNEVMQGLRIDSGILKFIYLSSKLFPEVTHERIKSLIDKYLIEQLDYFLYDFDKSQRQLDELFEYILQLKPETKEQETAYDNMIDQLNEATKNRKQIESNVTAHLSVFEWCILVVLLVIILFCIYFLNDNTAISIILTTMLSTASGIMLLTLYDLDSLRWQEQYRIWNPLQRLFREMNLLPYYPDAAITSGRIKPLKGKVRIAHYPNKYPDMSGKEVEETEL
ncbi:MAG: hypothetical protein PHS44_04915 [Candidatus Dojkabacteria bacterium]|jgi:Na+/melibiose symporter-like transporter|nr:hypothetical protein [Candidatus Dojkabacteria bacterium]